MDFSRLKSSLVWSFCASAVHNWMVRELKQCNVNRAATIRMPFIRENFPRSLGTKRVQGQEKWWSFDGKRFVLLYIWIFFECLYFNVQVARQGLLRVLLVVLWWQKFCLTARECLLTQPISPWILYISLTLFQCSLKSDKVYCFQLNWWQSYGHTVIACEVVTFFWTAIWFNCFQTLLRKRQFSKVCDTGIIELEWLKSYR